MKARITVTYVYSRYLRKSNICAVLDNRVAGCAQVDINVGTVVHAELSAGNYDGTVLYIGDVGGTINLSANEQALLDALDR